MMLHRLINETRDIMLAMDKKHEFLTNSNERKTLSKLAYQKKSD